MRIVGTSLIDCFELLPAIHEDRRGRFVKVFQKSELQSTGMDCCFSESYYTVSRKDVLRGLHFQIPPAACSKIVYCVHGAVWDVVLDIRKSSKTYGRYHSVELSAHKGNGVIVAAGFAHGFLALSRGATVLYLVTAEYDATCDAGILWNSAGIKWPVESPTISPRDAGFVSFQEFRTPFQ